MFMILNQSYIQKADGVKAQLIDICGKDAIVVLNQDQVLKISTDIFKTNFMLNV